MPNLKEPDFSSFNYFDTLFHNAKENSVLLISTEGIILEVNKAFIQAFGYAREEICGKNFAQLFTQKDQHKDMPRKELTTVLNQGQAYDNNYLVNKDGKITWVSGESLLIRNEEGQVCILKVIQNINEQKVSESSIIRLNDFNESILKSIEDVVIVVDDSMAIVKANDAFLRLFRKESQAVDTMNFADLIAPYDKNNELLKKIRETISTKKKFSNTQIEIKTIAGDERIFDISGRAMHHTMEGINILLVMHDITLQKQAEREREDVIGFVAHELRNPLANIILCNDIMEQLIKENKMDGINDFLQRSKNNVMRLNKMIAELYDATKVNSGNFVLELSEFNFDEMVKEAIATIEVLQPAYHIIVKGNGDIRVRGDRYRLIQVVTNYLSNGIKYSNGKTDVTITIGKRANSIQLSVKDEGLGIPKAQLPFIFERFFRAEKTRNLEGIGLGLFLCRQIILAHGGDVWAESEEGRGSSFYFSIPA